MSLHVRTLFLLFLSLFVASCSEEESPKPPAEEVVKVAPVFGTFGVDLSARALETKPGDDFFRHANGVWLDSNEIPAERSTWGVALIVHERAQERVKGIIEELGASSGAMGSPEQKVGDYYASWMDTAAINERGIKPLQPDLDRIAAIQDVRGLVEEFGRYHYVGSATPIYLGPGVNPDDPNQYNLNIGLSGLGLPDRDYYLLDTDEFKDIRSAYRAHIAQMLGFAGMIDPEVKANNILDLETRIAGYQWARADRRDRDKTHNPTSVADLKAQHQGFDWDTFLAAGNYAGVEEINIAHPDTIDPLIEIVNSTPLPVWKSYLSYHIITGNANLLSEEIDLADFEFWGKKINGQEQPLERWKRGVARVGDKSGLGELLGQIYVKRHFSESSKAKMEALVENLRKAYAERIASISWMGDETRQEALRKLAAFRAKIGYPNKWLDLSEIKIAQDDLFGNSRRIDKFFEDYDAARLSRPTDKDEWFMMPQTVNAYYMPPFNEIVFPAAILEPPFFDANADDAVNYGGIGAIIGHEMGHGFDDQGSKSDADGVKRNWWTDEDRKRFDERTSALAAQYSSFEAVPGTFVDGKFTLGENIGDLGGIEVAYHAYRLSLNGKEPPVIDGMTGDQRFFLSYAQSWRGKARDEVLLQYLKSDPHSPAKFRVNGVVRNVDAWYNAFDVQPTDAIYLPPEERVSIW